MGTEKSLIDGCRMMQAYDTLSINEAFAKEKLLRKYPFMRKASFSCVSATRKKANRLDVLSFISITTKRC
ncbi:hypothetical protein PO124_03925 [Bacillus licheniformis]|nr:hypothetical protein [Bacillus licheniformis]